MKTITLTFVRRENKIAKSGKPYVSVSIKAQEVEQGNVYINGFERNENKAWKVGDKINVELSQKEYNGKLYWNFEMPKEEKASTNNGVLLDQKLAPINRKLDAIIEHLAGNTRLPKGGTFDKKFEREMDGVYEIGKANNPDEQPL